MVQAAHPDPSADPSPGDGAIDPALCLAQADHRLASAESVLVQMVRLGPCRLLDDETVARVRALVGDLAAQLAAGCEDPDLNGRQSEQLCGMLREMLAGHRAILMHAHALAVEWRLTSALATRGAIDPLLPPLVRHALYRQVENDDLAAHAQAQAQALIAVQTSLGEALRRMQLPLAELPGDLLHLACAIRDAARAELGLPDLHALRREGAGADHQPGQGNVQGRLALLRQIVAGLGDHSGLALQIDQAGVPLFLSALALASGAPRELVTLATAEDDPARLALLLRMAGLSADEAAAQLLAIRPDADPELVNLAGDRATAERLLAVQGSVEMAR
jgi:hypothetical protein